MNQSWSLTPARGARFLPLLAALSLLADSSFAQPPDVRSTKIAAEVAVIESNSLAKDAEEARILAVLDEMDQHQRQGYAIVPKEDGRLLRLLVEATGAQRVVEIGTSNGYSGIWICLALRKTGGHLTTHEIDPERVRLAQRNFERAGVSELVTIVEGDAHETIARLTEPIDVLFIDADKPGYPHYLEKLLPLVRPGGLILGHNMHRPQPSPEYIKAITTNSALETVFLNMHAAGVAVTLRKR